MAAGFQGGEMEGATSLRSKSRSYIATLQPKQDTGTPVLKGRGNRLYLLLAGPAKSYCRRERGMGPLRWLFLNNLFILNT